MLLKCSLEKTLDSPLDCKEIQSVHHKGNHFWIFTERTDAETEATILWPPDEKNWLIGKDPDVEKDWRQEGKGTTEDEMAGWHHQLNGHEFEQTVGDSLSKLWDWCAAVHGVAKNQTWLSNWTATTADIQHCKSLRWSDRHAYCEMMVTVRKYPSAGVQFSGT